MKYKALIIFGGEGGEREVSLLGKRTVSALIDRSLFDPIFVEISKDGEWYIEGTHNIAFPTIGKDSHGLLLDGKIIPIDAAFPLLHGDMGEDGNIQGLLSIAHIPFVGCAALSGAVASDKILTKAIARDIGIRVVPGISFVEKHPDAPDLKAARQLAEQKVGYPMFIKPSGLGSSIGAVAVLSPDEFDAAYTRASILGSGRVLAEKFLSGRRELECAWFCDGERVFISSPAEVKYSAPFYSYDEKYNGGASTTLITNPCISAEISDTVKMETAKIAELIGCRDLCRADYFLSDGELYFNEINTMPGMTESSLWLTLAEGSGLSKKEIITALLLSAVRRG